MTAYSIHHSRIFDFIPKQWLSNYLSTAAAKGGMSFRLLDLGGETVLSAPSPSAASGEDGWICPEEGWSRVAEVMAEEITELDCSGEYLLMALPISHRGERLGHLAVCALYKEGREASRLRIEPVLALAASHLEGMAEVGYEVESLSGEVVRVYEELALIYRLTECLGTEVQLEEIFRVVADEVEKVLQPSDIVLQLVDEEKGVLRSVFSFGAHRSEALTFTPPLDSGVIGRAFVNHRSILISELAEERQEPPWPFPAKRLLVAPLVAGNKALGVIFATDKRDGSDFDSQEDKLFTAISSVAAIAIKNSQLFGDIKNLFEGFINASVTAVESRDPTTAGHSTRVALLTVELAKRVTDLTLPPFKDISFTGEQLLEMRYAGLLHDFGKIGVRESVLQKETKLSQGDMESIRERFNYIAERKTRESLEKKLEFLLREGKDAYLRAAGAIEGGIEGEIAQLEETFKMLEVMNDPRVLMSELPELEKLNALTGRFYVDPRGERRPYLTTYEFKNLHVLKGSLNSEERYEIETHVTHTYNFLTKIPWTKSFPQIAEMVYAHHEKLDGSGYPRRLKAEAIPVQAKIMTVADIFDALTAWDRPYKKAVPVEKALFILEMEAKEGKLDAQLVRLFREARIYTVVDGLRPKP